MVAPPYGGISRLTREATCGCIKQWYYDDAGNRTQLVQMNAGYSKDGNGRMRCEVQEKRPGRKVQEGIWV